MPKYDEKDIAFYGAHDGDFDLGPSDAVGTTDFRLTDNYESAKQDIANRIRTQTKDWRSHPNIGGDLELLEGEPNTRETANRGVNQIMSTLTYDGRFRAADLQVRAVPVSIYQIDYYTFLNAGEDEPIVVTNGSNL
ncbi:hypothetical protein SAMN02799624_05430 [Paenibacillus sp. UNC496MF]|uniref:hypothetical protein n=1 Tax=Paenibacillus sp. UNC496MF TaxID=1502753 RepID=UPI0008EB74A3|nr:hypothetical protein [Paenibacillus sp. UNC496MF]SFJ66012.1 hypothetical protein SAMN02799624_05430 [Paenibacillus sp. UNC496MF]